MPQTHVEYNLLGGFIYDCNMLSFFVIWTISSLRSNERDVRLFPFVDHTISSSFSYNKTFPVKERGNVKP